MFFIPVTDRYEITNIWMRDFDHVWLTEIMAERHTWRAICSIIDHAPRRTCQLYVLGPDDLRHDVVRHIEPHV